METVNTGSVEYFCFSKGTFTLVLSEEQQIIKLIKQSKIEHYREKLKQKFPFLLNFQGIYRYHFEIQNCLNNPVLPVSHELA